MGSTHRTTDPPEDLLLERFVAADEARFRGDTDWAASSLVDLPRPVSSKLNGILECLELLAIAGRSESAQEPCEPTILLSDGQEADDRGHGGPDHPPLPTEYAGYQIETQLGRGGFGVVYKAWNEKLGRAVAIKIPLPHIIAGDSARQRFELEARASAALRHPNIVIVHETYTDAQPAIVYEYCDGGTLSSFVNAQTGLLSESLILDVMICVAGALRHAHSRGVLHRDLKPANILLQRAELEEWGNGFCVNGKWWVPKLCDFGLARIVDEASDMTQTDMIIGTVNYMAPEQAAGNLKETGTYTDVFSFGAMLYWMMTGEPPFKAESRAVSLMQIELLDPIPPTKLRPGLSRDLQSICLKCLQKAPQNRYDSAAAILHDLQALQRGEPISVRSPSMMTLARQFRRRHPLRFMAIVFTLMAVTAGLVLEFRHGRQQQRMLQNLNSANTRLNHAVEVSRTAERQANDQRRKYQSLLYASDIKLADQAWLEGDLSTCEAILKRYIPADGEADLRDLEWSSLWQETHSTPTPLSDFEGAGYNVAFSADGQYAAACGADATVRIFDATTWTVQCVLQTPQQEVNGVAFSGDAELLASAGDDGTVRLWDWQNQRQVLSVTTASQKAFAVEFSADGRRFFTCGNSPHIEWWSVNDGLRGGILEGHEGTVETFSISDDGRYLYSASADFRRCVFDLATNQLLIAKDPVHQQRVSSIAGFRLDDRHLFLSGMIGGRTSARSVLIVDDAESAQQWRLPSAADGVQSVAVSADGQTAACGLRSGVIVLYDLQRLVNGDGLEDPGLATKRWMAHEGRVYGLAFHPDGDHLLSTGNDGKLYRWQLNDNGEELRLSLPAALDVFQPQDGAVSVSPSGRTVIAVTENGLFLRYSANNRYEIKVLDERLSGWEECWLSPDERYAATSSVETGLKFWALEPPNTAAPSVIEDIPLAKVIWELSADSSAQTVSSVTWLNDDQILLTNHRSATTAKLRDAATGTLIRELQGATDEISDSFCGDASADGRRVAFGSGNTIVCFDLQTEERFLLEGHSSTVTALAFARDTEHGRFNVLVSGSSDRTLRIWDLESRRTKHVLRGHPSAVRTVMISRPGRTIISVSATHEVNFWRLGSGSLVRRNWLSASGLAVPWAAFPSGAVQIEANAIRLHFAEPTSVIEAIRG